MHALVTWTEYKLTPDDEQWMVRFAVCLIIEFNCFCTARKSVQSALVNFVMMADQS